ncbi:MAG: hypothetical protein J0M02_00785 [Planctomycetes bacterium]|nr:hypothetical protein [Planctomycetota bacterium]
MFSLDIARIPFSVRDSWLRISRLGKEGGLAIHSLHGGFPQVAMGQQVDEVSPNLFRIVLLVNGTVVEPEIDLQPHRLILRSGAAEVLIAFADGSTIAFSGRGCAMRLEAMQSSGWVQARGAGDLLINLLRMPGCAHLRVESGIPARLEEQRIVEGHQVGQTRAQAAFAVGDGRPWRAALRISEAPTGWDGAVPEAAASAERGLSELEVWMRRLPRVPAEFYDAACRAWHLMWMLQVPATGLLHRRSALMSKLWMNQVWSWDNCFMAIGYSHGDSELAWDQVQVMLDHQTAEGQLPDTVNDRERQYSFTKPPVYGWACGILLDRLGEDACLDRLRQVHEPIARLTGWWYRHRNASDLSPYYLHGNDSGWDNATAYDQGFPTCGADLAALLVLQARFLARSARLLGRTDEVGRWTDLAGRQLAALLRCNVRDGAFCSPHAVSGAAAPNASLVNRIPVILGAELPEAILSRIADDLRPDGRFVTSWGPATEAVDSPHYLADGYWRGPIWGPSTYLLVDGLRRAGRRELGDEIARRFCRLCAGDGVFWENYDALSGAGLRCPGYSWTAATFLDLATSLS